MVYHLLERDRQGRVVTEHDLSYRVAHQDHVDPFLLQHPGEERIVCRQHHDALSATFHL